MFSLNVQIKFDSESSSSNFAPKIIIAYDIYILLVFSDAFTVGQIDFGTVILHSIYNLRGDILNKDTTYILPNRYRFWTK